MNPRPKPIVELFECSPWDASGISSSTTTKIMAPAAKAKNMAKLELQGEIKILLLKRQLVQLCQRGRRL